MNKNNLGMDALGDYDSDADSDASSAAAEVQPQHSNEEQPTVALLPWPAWQGPSGWIHGHLNHLSALDNVTIKLASPSAKPSNKAPTTDATMPTPLLAQQLRSTHEFGNPKQMETTVTSLGIKDPFGSNISQAAAAKFEEWELNDLMALEEQARQQQQTAAVSSTPASDFVQHQISRALMRHER